MTHKVANVEKKVPREWINEAGDYVTQEFVNYKAADPGGVDPDHDGRASQTSVLHGRGRESDGPAGTSPGELYIIGRENCRIPENFRVLRLCRLKWNWLESVVQLFVLVDRLGGRPRPVF